MIVHHSRAFGSKELFGAAAAIVIALSITARPYAQTNEAASLDRQWERLYNEGRFSEAIPVLRRILAIRESVLGINHPDFADALNKLAIMHHSQGQYADAESLYKRSLEIREKAL